MKIDFDTLFTYRFVFRILAIKLKFRFLGLQKSTTKTRLYKILKRSELIFSVIHFQIWIKYFQTYGKICFFTVKLVFLHFFFNQNKYYVALLQENNVKKVVLWKVKNLWLNTVFRCTLTYINEEKIFEIFNFLGIVIDFFKLLFFTFILPYFFTLMSKVSAELQ